MYFSSQSSFCFLSAAASLFCLHSIATTPNSARPKGTPTAAPTVAARSEVEGSGGHDSDRGYRRASWRHGAYDGSGAIGRRGAGRAIQDNRSLIN